MITATALVRPDESILGLSVSSVRKKRSRRFRCGSEPRGLVKGATELNVDLDEHIAFVIEAMSSIVETLGLAGQSELVAD